MSSTQRVLFVLAAAIITGAAYYQQDGRIRYAPRSQATSSEDARGAAEYYRSIKANVNTGEIDPADHWRMAEAVRHYEVTHADRAQNMSWTEMGPDNIGGRVRSIAVDPNDWNRLWAGGVSGGLWRSDDGANTWIRLSGIDDALIISTIAVLGNGHLFYGTGSSNEGISGGGSSGFIGTGLYRTTDGGTTFEQVIGPATPWSQSSEWSIIDKIVADPNDPNKLWVAYDRGLVIYDDANDSFTDAGNGTLPSNQKCRALEVSSDGQTLICAFGSNAYLSRDGGQNFVELDNGTGFPQSSISRMEFAISPDDANYIYVMASTGSGQMSGAWATTDNGYNWARIWPAGFGTNGVPELDIFGDNRQGWYDQILSVVPGEPDRVWLGGVSLWTTSLNGQPSQLALTFDAPGCFTCVHADVHEITWSPDGHTAYVGCDGGVYVSPNKGGNFYAANRFLNITQYYSVAYSPKGKAMGGSQDNGTSYIRLQGGTTEQEAIEVYINDGFDCDISQMDPHIMFATYQQGALARSNDEGGNFGDFYAPEMIALADADGNLGDFNTNIRLYENWDDPNSPDSTDVSFAYEVSSVTTVGAVLGSSFDVSYSSRKTPAVQLGETVVLTLDMFSDVGGAGTQLVPDSTYFLNTRLPDRVESLFAVGFSGTQGVWVTRDALNFTDATEWWKVIDNVPGSVTCLEWAADGNALFVGTSNGTVVRVRGFNGAYDAEHGDHDGSEFANTIDIDNVLAVGSATITGLAPDPNNTQRLLVTIGNYGGSAKVRLSQNVMDANPTFTNVWNVPSGLVGMPVYDGIINKVDPNNFIVGTEFGIMATQDGGATWDIENNGIPKVPVFAVRQQVWDFQNNPYGPDYVTNPYVIYAGTHGRGIFRSDTYLGVTPPGNDTGANNVAVGDMVAFPNPASAQVTIRFDLARSGQVGVRVFDLNGRLVRAVRPSNFNRGEGRAILDVSDMDNGTYVAEVSIDGIRRTARFVVAH
ncbi:MAG: T9SS type A sorting domain-containing protein [Flavobacteriales bacterium]|nr:T9SS type A sorting domain-containing protein [Flavobacteriales bacterium]MCB9166006.1 T9SS type A sorting domain-containing protein [Flavobacteriales bacterium]